MLVSDFDYHLPPELIAQEPLADRAASRMLHVCRNGQECGNQDPCGDGRLARSGGAQLPEDSQLRDTQFREFPDLLRPDDLVVFNNTRVFPARLFGHRSGSHSQPVSQRNPASKEFLRGKIEALLTKQVGDWYWEALVRPGRKLGIGERLFFGENDELQAEIIARGESGERTLRFDPVSDFFAVLEGIGHVPLPPYIDRQDAQSDRERYQTVYARERGSVAAPTAGLHFTPEILARVKERGIQTAEVTLHVGLGTFQPIHAEVVEEHHLHREWYGVTAEAAKTINRALAAKRRVIAIGTTAVRTLEYTGRSGQIEPGTGETALFIYPGYQFRVVSAMLTNFHLPKSTLLMLVSALAGRDLILKAYRHAVEQKYRFYSYGDCMFIE